MKTGEEYERHFGGGRQKTLRCGDGAGGQKQRAAHAGGYGALRRRVPGAGMPEAQRCGHGGTDHRTPGRKRSPGGRRPGGGHPECHRVGDTPGADAPDALVGDVFGRDSGPVRPGEMYLSRGMRLGAPAHRPAPGGPEGFGGPGAGGGRQHTLPGREAPGRGDLSADSQRGRYGKRHSGSLRSGGGDHYLQCGKGAGNRGAAGVSAENGRLRPGRRHRHRCGGGTEKTTRLLAQGTSGPHCGGHLSVCGGGDGRMHLPAPGRLPGAGGAAVRAAGATAEAYG